VIAKIEFGWSEPDRRGLIFPVEFSDFNPAESWPDSQYWKSGSRGLGPKLSARK